MLKVPQVGIRAWLQQLYIRASYLIKNRFFFVIFQSFRKPQCGCQGSLGCSVTLQYMGSLSPVHHHHHRYVDYDDDAGDAERDQDVHDDDDDIDDDDYDAHCCYLKE